MRRNELPVLYVVGMPSRASATYLPPHGEPDLISSAGAFAKAAYDCSMIENLTAEKYIEIVTEAVAAVSRLPFGPVLLGVPQDLLSMTFVSSEILQSNSKLECQSLEIDIDRALKLIGSSKKTVILVDDYLFRSQLAAEFALGDLSNLLSAPVFQVAYRRGPMFFQQLSHERVPNYVGLYQPTHTDHFQLLHSADLLITIEDRNMYPRVVGPLPECPKIAITSNERAVAKNGYLSDEDILLGGDVASNLVRLTDKLKDFGFRSTVDTHNIQDPDIKRCEGATELVNAIANGLRDLKHPIIIDDSQMFGGLIANNYGLLPSSVKVLGSHGGFVGSGLPLAVGLAASNSTESIVCTLGDQGFTNALQALAVAGEHQTPLLILVCNNGSSVSLRKQARHEGLEFAGHPFLVNNINMSYAAVARGFGLSSSVFVWTNATECDQVVIESSAVLSKIIAEVLLNRKPYLLELVVPGDPDFWEGVWSVEGLEGLSARSVASSTVRQAY